MKTHVGRSTVLLLVGLAGSLMAQSGTSAVVNAANYGRIVAPDSLALAFGTGYSSAFTPATVTVQNSNYILPTTIAGTSLKFTDNSNAGLTPFLYMVSPSQINFVVPSNAMLGAGMLSVGTGTSTPVLVSQVSPGLLTADASGKGAAAGQLTRVTSSGLSSTEQIVNQVYPNPVPSSISLNAAQGDKVYVTIYGTGIRNHSLNPVIALVNGVQVPVTYAGAQPQYPGLDMVSFGPIPSSLAGAGTVNVNIIVDGVPANPVQVAFR